MRELKEIARITCKRLRGKTTNAKIVFYQSNKNWNSYFFWIKPNNVLELADKKFLECIQKDDPNAVIVDSDDFIEANGDGSILIDDMVSSVLLLYSKGQANISEFLEKYAEEKQQQKVDRSSLKEVVKHCWDRLWKKCYSNAVFWKKNECWDYHMFSLSENNIIPREDEVLLKEIQKKDNNAIVVDKYSFYYLGAEYIAEKIEQYRQNETNRNHNLSSNTGHNIGVFLDKYSWSAVVVKHKEQKI